MSPSRKIEVPYPYPESELSLWSAQTTPLAEAYNAIVNGIETEADLHNLFISQGVAMLQNLQPEASRERLQFAIRHLTKPHKHEAAFWEPSDDQELSETRAKVLIPYTPQYGYLQETEQRIGKPLRMTFGLWRSCNDTTREATHRVARANLWVARDYTSPFPDGYKLIKDINTYRELDSYEEAERFMSSRKRSAERIGFVLDRVISQLE